MKKIFNGMFMVILCATVAVVVNLSVKDADSRVVINVAPDVAGEEMRAVVIEDFETGKIANNVDDDGWFVTTNPKRYTKAKDAETLKKKNPVMELQLKYIDGGSRDLKVEDLSVTGLGKEKKKILGLNFRFRYLGKNTVSIEPPKEVDWKTRKPVFTYSHILREDIQERGIQLPGRAKAISIWTHGRGFPYAMELWVKDFKGDVHILKEQSIDFVGWRPLTFKIPSDVVQSADTYPGSRTAKLVRIVLKEVTDVSGPHSISSSRRSTDVYVFFDQIKVLTDVYEVFFDGQDLHKAFDDEGSKASQK